MWQHRWALWSGVLGATASCLVKIAVSSRSPLQRIVQRTICEPYLTNNNNVDLDVVVFNAVYRILGDLMIKHGINLMKGFKILRQQVIEPTILFFNIFEIDGCQCILFGPRILCFVGMLLLNAFMVACFLKGMNESGSVAGTALSAAANFTFSAAFGYFVWEERFATTWWFGFVSVVTGALLLSTVQTTDKTSSTSKTPPPPPLWNLPPRKIEIHRPPSLQQTTPTKSASALRQYGTNSSSSSSKRTSTTITPPKSLFSKKKQLTTSLTDRTFANECPLCEGQLFDESTGESLMAIADLSPNCFHAIHAKCLKQQSKSPNSSNSKCPVCDKSISMWISAKQAAHFAGFWMDRVETCLQTLGPRKGDDKGLPQPLPASVVREHLQKDPTLTDTQKRYIDDDPTGLGKGLASALEWGGYVDYNSCFKGHVGWSQCLRTQGVWKYDARKDDLWLWEWGKVHPRQRCDQCQFLKRPLPVECEGCNGSSEGVHYCSEPCQRRDWQRHKMTCQLWQTQGPNQSSSSKR
jgi:hypothetical protein